MSTTRGVGLHPREVTAFGTMLRTLQKIEGTLSACARYFRVGGVHPSLEEIDLACKVLDRAMAVGGAVYKNAKASRRGRRAGR